MDTLSAIKKYTVRNALRQLEQCDPGAEIGMSISGIPMFIPINMIMVSQNLNNEEIVVLNIKLEDMKKIFDSADNLMRIEE